MDPTTFPMQLLTALGLGAYVPLVLSGIGFFSVLSTVYPETWPAAKYVHIFALLLGKAAPAVPAKSL